MNIRDEVGNSDPLAIRVGTDEQFPLNTVRQNETILLEKDIVYWSSKLNGKLCPVDLPLDRPRQRNATIQRGSRFLRLKPETVLALRHRCEGSEADLFTVLLAAFECLLFRYT